MTQSAVAELPRWYAAAHGRNLASLALRTAYRLRVHGAFHAGTEGPLVLVTASESVLAGPLIRAAAPRPVHVVANAATMQVMASRTVAAMGDIPVDGPAAIRGQRAALAALADGRAVVFTGSLVSAAYVVAASGARVAPVALLGVDRKRPTDPPRARSAVDVYFMPPVTLDLPGDPLRAGTRRVVAEELRQVVRDAEREAWQRSGRIRPAISEEDA